MDSREQPPQPQGPQGLHQHQYQHQQQHQQQQQQQHHHHHAVPPPPNMMVGPASYPSNMSMSLSMTNANVNSNANPSSLITPNSSATIMSPATARFPFNSVVPQPQLPAKPSDSVDHTSPYEGSSPALRPCAPAAGFNMDSAKKKRGRPRKYSPDGNIALGLAPTAMGSSAGQADSTGTPSTNPAPKKHRGRPAGSGKKQLDALGAGGVGFTPHVIMVQVGEDVASKIMAFSQQGPRTVCILSANGAVSNVTLRQPATAGGTVTYEGRFEIVSLSGSFAMSDDNGGSRTGSLNVSLAGSDGRLLGGGVVGMLTAVSNVQVIVGSFIADGKKSKLNPGISSPSSAPASSQMLNFGGPMTPATPPSQGPSSESSDDNGDVPFNRGPDLYNNASQPLHNMPMYHHIWAGQSQQ